MENKILKMIEENNLQHAFIMIYFYDHVSLGVYKDSKLMFAEEERIEERLQLCKKEYCYNDALCYEIHVFNETVEVRWCRQSNKITVIRDTEDFMEEKMFVIGSNIKSENGCTKLEQYGRVLLVPFEMKRNEKNPLRLVVHHLFDNDTAAIAGYRLAGIEGGNI